MTSSQSHISEIATVITPQGRYDIFITLFRDFAKYVENHEPRTSRYEIVRQVKREDNGNYVEDGTFVVLGTYQDQEALKVHKESEEMKTFLGRLNEAGAKDAKVDIKFVKEFAGFKLRE